MNSTVDQDGRGNLLEQASAVEAAIHEIETRTVNSIEVAWMLSRLRAARLTLTTLAAREMRKQERRAAREAARVQEEA